MQQTEVKNDRVQLSLTKQWSGVWWNYLIRRDMVDPPRVSRDWTRWKGRAELGGRPGAEEEEQREREINGVDSKLLGACVANCTTS